MFILQLCKIYGDQLGAFVAADKEIIDYLKYNMRSQMFAKVIANAACKGALKRLDLIRSRPELKKKPGKMSMHYKWTYKGFDIGTTQSC